MITAAKIKEKIEKEKEEKRGNQVTAVIGAFEKAAEQMLENSSTYYRFTDPNEIKRILYVRDSDQPELKKWLEETGFQVRANLNRGTANYVDLFFNL